MLQQEYTPRIMYDSEEDVLYIKFGSNYGATAHEIGENIIIYTDDSTQQPRTITILDYKWLEQNRPGWDRRLPIDFTRDIKPLLKTSSDFS